MNSLVKALIAVAVIGVVAFAVLSGGSPTPDPSPNTNNTEKNQSEPGTANKEAVIPPPPEVRVSVSGSVTDELGGGLEGATVRVEKVTGSASEPKYNRVDQVFTNSSGVFEAASLLPARYRFVATLDGFAVTYKSVQIKK